MENREIKFRGKAKNGEWIYGWLIKERSGENLISDGNLYDDFGMRRTFITVDPETVGQYINKKSSNKTKIYEGDIIRTTYEGSLVKVGIVELFKCEYILRQGSFAQSIPALIRNKWELEVIGNEFDNPELLNKDK